MILLLWLLAIASFTLAASIDLTSRSTACNNSPGLCSKNYDRVVHLGAHDSPFVRDASTSFSTSGNQYYNSTVQLAAGVRLLTAQVHKSNSAWHLCHSSCDLLDAGLLSSWLSEIKSWMDKNPNEVVTILLVNSDGATRSQLHAEFTKSTITSYAYKPAFTAAPTTWPTLQTLISADTRLITFVASLNASDTPAGTSYLMDEFTYVFENDYNNVKFADFNCEPNRPSGLSSLAMLGTNRMPFMNHFLYTSSGGILNIETPDVDNITTTNSQSTTTLGALGSAADNCTTAYNGRPPTFLLVDFFDEGPAIDTVDRLNGVTSPVGRTAVPSRSSGQSRNDASWTGVQALVKQVQSGEKPSMGAWIWGAGKWSWGGINLNGGGFFS